MPISVFWTLSQNVERIAAEQDLRNYRAAANSHGGEQAQEYVEDLAKRVGKVFVVDPIITAKKDEAGFADLRNMANGFM